ncbi:ABC transporter substrate-binding protein [Streptomyces sp. MnatMP-M17]|uniref:ABC transporter substrate-binding protein n=1 Tax=unclassified Streptomyces TaxID=2593676 RepID=UPI00081EC247|nr:ABC transporter substrate-binding protein [Streptomyces sp. MnatMP-M17]MYZ33993.1 transporter substrate-binding domain-containing protein [Streptomyces sp. SID4917]SCF63296.1 polar amino acid transport system substrate-binding protein [Streptomyces sp. MnatMP-M17]
MPSRPVLRTTAALLGLVAALSLSACGNSADGATDEVVAKDGGKDGLRINLSPDQKRITTPKVDSIAALLPAAIRERGTLEVADSAGSVPPLSFYATDDKTVIGVESDIASLIADVLGLKLSYNTVDWANIFVGLDSGKYDVGISNITVTEERKEKYDFATYRLDNLAFEAKKGGDWKVASPKDVAGRTIGVGSGTNQEKLLVDWSKQNVKNGLKATDIKYYQNASDYYLALGSGRLDAYLGPNPVAAYHAASTGETEIIGTYSGGGADVQGKIAATTKKDNGLIKALHEALGTVIGNGTYEKVLARWGLSNEAVTSSELNPPGLPKTE